MIRPLVGAAVMIGLGYLIFPNDVDWYKRFALFLFVMTGIWIVNPELKE